MTRVCMTFLLAGMLALGVSVSSANIPDPSLSTVNPVLMVPDNPNITKGTSLDYTVIVVGGLGPVDNAIVEIEFSAATAGLIAYCSGADGKSAQAPDGTTAGTGVISTTTNASGEATFNISAGGCIIPGQTTPFVAEVRADGVNLGNPYVLSPDAVNDGGETTADSGASNCATTTGVGLSDAVFLTGPFVTSNFEFCADFNGDGAISLGDASIATQFIIDANSCQCDPYP